MSSNIVYFGPDYFCILFMFLLMYRLLIEAVKIEF